MGRHGGNIWTRANEAAMIGELSLSEIENLLHTEVIARIGCHTDGHTYIVPVTYAYDGDAIFGYSPEGMKLTMMRENPRVCVEVDHIDDPATWRSVIAHGIFQELSGAAAEGYKQNQGAL